jgi:predicted nucleic acid-binding protein
MDACCINRPFDDQRDGRLRLESESFLILLEEIEKGNLHWLGSVILDFEIEQTPDKIKQKKSKNYLLSVHKKINMNLEIKNRADELQSLGFKTFDALHISCAEYGKSDAFLTTDDKLLKLAVRNQETLRVKVFNITSWTQEYLK